MNLMKFKSCISVLTFITTGIATLFLSSCATTSGAKPNPEDPLEPFNRAMFRFNDSLDTAILKPTATFYNIIMPKPLNEGVSNFFRNINTLPTIANDVLQAKFHQALNDTWRFGVNSTLGLLGFFDVATRINLETHYEDFGLTLARWGYKDSTYLVLPFFGPSTIRDALAYPVDYYAFSVYPHIKSKKIRYSIYGIGVIDRRAQLLQFQSVYEEAALDKYVFLRNAYKQRRASQMGQGQPMEEPTAEQTKAVETAKKVD